MTKVKEKILSLRKEGLSYDEIAEKVPCSKGTVSYHCGDGVKKKTLSYQQKRRNEEPIIKKMGNFRSKTYGKLRDFQRRDSSKMNGSMLKNKMEKNFSISELRKHIGENPTCYLTGRKIDLDDSKSFSFDHFVPSSKKGKNILSNLRIACSEANMAKNDMMYEEFIQLCKEVVEYHNNLVSC
jgi:5-methylcytosine-specific restriction endonuclease McrA